MKRILLTSTFALALTACGSSGMHSGLGNADAATLDLATSGAGERSSSVISGMPEKKWA